MKYKCSICGHIHDEEVTCLPLEDLNKCPICGQAISKFEEINNEEKEVNIEEGDLAYPQEFARTDSSARHMDSIHQLSVSGKPIIASMGTKVKMPNWDDVVVLGTQLNPPPLEEEVDVNTQTVIGKNALKPMVIESPVYISHMSFGALSKEAKIALSKGSAIAKTAMCSGEGGILPEEMDAAYKYIFEYVPNKYSVNDDNLKNSDAIEIKIGQATKPGMGGHLPGDKVTPEIAKIRSKPEGEDIISPSSFSEINSKEDLKDLVSDLRSRSDGRPIGIKIAAGRIEDDLEYVTFAEPDFITIDGRGGATGASPLLIRDGTSVPTIFALYRARKYLDEISSNIDLVITGGLRVSSDFAKAIAMGADAIAVATAPLMAAACQQYRICGTGECPVGIATQNEELRSRFKIEESSLRVANYFNGTLEELKSFGRITANKDIHDLNINDLATFNMEISKYTNIKHV